MIVFRGLQGLLGGSMIPTVFTSAFFYFTGQRRVIAAAVIGTISLAPTLGPTIGGWITENYSWHWLFFINLLPGSIVAIGCRCWCISTGRTGHCCAAPTIPASY
jgi:MFS transporter, DHA2 family, multidrug resistance protein